MIPLENVSVLIAFIAGFASFISPCVLPIVPGYLSFISGVSFEEMSGSAGLSEARRRIFVNSMFFVVGFSIVFISLGASATFFGQILREQLDIITKIAGAVIILFGIHMTGLVRIPFLNYEKRFHTKGKPLSAAGALVVGLAFAFGWTPCIGPILASILTLASQQESVSRGVFLLSAYSAGLGIPFLLAGLSISVFYAPFNRMKRHLPKIEMVSGILLILVGVLIMTNTLTIISAYLSQWFPFLNEIG
jgi:cytochrome c-type biogenesis protein